MYLDGSGPTGDTLTYAATGLPGGLYLNTSTGEIGGTINPQDDLYGPYTVNENVSDSAGNYASQTFQWVITPKVTLTNPGPQTSVEGVEISTMVPTTTYSGSGTLAYGAAGLPAGLSISSTTGDITGSPSADSAGIYTVAIYVGDGTYYAQDIFTWTVTPHISFTLVPPTQHSAVGDSPASGLSVSATDVGDLTVSYLAEGLPTGLYIHADTGVFYGTISAAAGTYPVTVIASNGTGTGSDSDSVTFFWEVGALVVNNPGPQLNMVGDTGVGDSSAFPTITSHENGDATFTYLATGLSTGLSMTTGGVITGETTTAGSWTVVVTATDSLDNTATMTFAWTVAAPIALANPGGQSITEGQNIDLPLVGFSAEGETLTYSYSGALPPGLTLDTTTNVIMDSATSSGTYSTTITATDTSGHSTSQTFTWTVAKVSPINPGDQTFTEGDDDVDLPLSYFADSTDTVTFGETGLPTGLSINTSGVILGSLGTGTAGTYNVTITATDDSIISSQTFVLTVVPDVAISFIGTQNNVVGDTVSLQIGATDASGNALTYSLTGTLPSGLTLYTSTGVIGGTITSTGGPYSVTVTAADGSISASQSFTWNVASISLTNPGVQASTSGTYVTLALTGDGSGTLTYSDDDSLPAGLTIDPSTGVITGQLSSSETAETYDVTVTVTVTGGPSTSQTFEWYVAPQLTLLAPGDQTNAVGDTVSIQLSSVDGANAGVTYSVSGLPTGVTYSPTSGLISGSISTGDDTDSPYTITLSATDGEVTTPTQTITWTVTAASTSSSSSSTAATVTVIVPGDRFDLQGDTVSATVAAYDDDGDTFTYTETGLPDGLTLNADTGVISGTVSSDADSSTPDLVTITADATGGSTASGSATFNWTVNALRLVSPSPQQSSPGTITPLNMVVENPGAYELTFSATGLPGGLSINTSTGEITGTISSDDDASIPYDVVVTVSGDGESSSQAFFWTVNSVFLTNPGQQVGYDGQSASLTLAASTSGGGTIVFSASGLPAGLTISSSGVISGTIDPGADQQGFYAVTVTAAVGTHSDNQTFIWYVYPALQMEIYGDGDQYDLVGDAVSVPISAYDPFGGTTAYAETGTLPDGVSFDTSTGLFSGTIAADAASSTPYNITVSASDSAGGNSPSVSFTWTVAAFEFDGPGDQTATVGLPFSLDLAYGSYVPTGGANLTYSVTGLPGGLTLNTATGIISGTPTTAGSFVGSVTASSGTLSVVNSVSWQITAVGVAEPGDQTSSEGQTVTLQLAGRWGGGVYLQCVGVAGGAQHQ